jgi:aryl-alcohol dehydrogenase-like predicted oxidoreductase
VQFATLAKTGVRVSRIALGTGAFGTPAVDAEESLRLIACALDAGVNVIDTADIYAGGESERLVGRAIAGRRDEVFLVSKFWAPMGHGLNDGGVSRHWIIRAVEASLTRLNTDYIDMYQQHRPEFGVDPEESLSALSDLVQQGKVRYIGASTFPAELIVEADWIARTRNLRRFTCFEVPYSILARSAETAVLPTCLRYSVSVMAYSPLTNGWLGGQHSRESGIRESAMTRQVPEKFDQRFIENQSKFDVVERLRVMADRAGCSLAEYAVAWVLEHPAVTSVIVGTKNVGQLDAALHAAERQLSDDDLDEIDTLVRPGLTVNPIDDQWTPPGYPPSVYPRLPALHPESRRRLRSSSQ